MTPDQLRALIEAGEQLEVEFKGEEREPLSDRDLVETVVCLANRTGDEPGWLLVGVEDDGRVTGSRPRHESGRTDPARVQALISNRTRPALTVQVELVKVAEGSILAISVPVSRQPLGTAKGLYLRRVLGGDGKPACRPFHFHEMQGQQADRGQLDYSALSLPGATMDDLDPLEFDRYRRSIRENRGRSDEALLNLPDEDFAKAIGAISVEDGSVSVRVLGLLLFGRSESLSSFLPVHEIAFQVLDGIKVETNDFLRWPLLRAMEELESRFRARNHEEEVIVGMLRIGVPDYPPSAFREGVANALIHRDYTHLGAVHVQWHSDRIEIMSPGGFPEGVRLDNLLVTQPRPRNPLLADAFKRAGLVERTARGIDTIFYEQLRNGRPAPSYERSNESSVTLVLPGGAANLDFAGLVAEEGRDQRPLRLDDLLLLNHIYLERRSTSPEAAAVIQKPETEARSRLQHLVETGLIEARGERKGRSYHLSAATYRRLGMDSAYVRQRGFEPIQQEQMVLQYVQTHGAIARKEAAELCRISGPQAYRLLQQMVNKGVMRQVGKSGRAVRYERKSN